ncbi:zinc metalloprotease HtpX [Pontibacillus marinus]|uniref:Peptidase M48 domain-containing protein n=1 Tax=Pontibacillus marinus BH030004 = DSM 16465 TaxID=1385511 RepID=A0A0A5G3Q7_9BACI|nr:zinc metalloprotease HtpX [Pontibacillus marinus]KGX86674.1 hypothetical protein N783_11805 [Pontibacillus marinus BH030004 = DSM 16465]
MYITDFIRNLFKISKIGVLIYLILNATLIILIFQDILTGVIFYVISLILALSPIGESLLRLQHDCKPIRRKEHIERLDPLFNEVYTKAKELDPTISDNVSLFISKDENPNAFATGRKTICLSKGFLDFTDNEIKATLAHEFGHLSNKDTDLILVVTVGNMLVSLAFTIYKLIFMVVGMFFSYLNEDIGSRIITIFIDLLLTFMVFIWTKLGTLLVLKTIKKNEYEADQFAYKCGYGMLLIQVLDQMNELEFNKSSKGLWATLSSNHPDADQRIGSLQFYSQTGT